MLADRIVKPDVLIICSQRCGASLLAALLSCSKVATIDLSGTIGKRMELRNTDQIFTCKSNDLKIISFLRLDENLWTKRGIYILDDLHSVFKSTGCKLVWLTRDPLVASMSCSKQYGGSVQNSMQLWYVANCIVMHFFESLSSQDKLLIRFEDLLCSNCFIRALFSFCAIPYDDQFLDFSHFLSCLVVDVLSKNNALKPQLDIEKIDNHPKTLEAKNSWEIFRKTPIVKYLKYDQNQRD